MFKTGETLLNEARRMVPALAARASATEAARSVPAATLTDFHAAGLLRTLQPTRFGGHQLGFGVFSRLVETLAEGCAASAWVFAVLAEHQWIIASMPEAAQRAVWRENPLAVASSSLAPREIARAVAGGWELSGRFPFSSGCQHAQWAIVGARAPQDDGSQPVRYLLIPMQKIEIDDDWHVLGLRGTGSRSLVLNQVFVPADHTVLLHDLMTGATPGSAAVPDYPLLRTPRGYLVPFSLPPVMFTLARRALALMAQSLRARVSRGTQNLVGSEVVHLKLGEAAAAIDLAVLIMHTRREQSVAASDAGALIRPEDSVRNRRDVAFAAMQLRHGVNLLTELNGARTVYETDPLNALLRDILTIDTHMVVARPGALVPYGRMLLGLPPESAG